MDKMRLQILLSAVDKVTGPLKAIQAGSSATVAKMKELRESIKSLEKQKGLIDNYRNMHKAVKGTTAQLAEAQAGIKKLAAEHAAAGTVTAAMQRQMDKAQATAKGLKEQLRGNQQALQELRDKMKTAGLSTTGLSSQQTGLTAKINTATAALNTQRQALERQAMVEKRLAQLREHHGNTMMKLAKWGAASAGAQMLGQRATHALLEPVKTFASAETAQTQLKVAFMQTDGSVVPEFQQLLGLANQLGDKLPGTTADFIEMMTVLRKEGMSAKAVLGGLGEAAANLGVLLQVGPQEAASRMAKMQDSLRASEGEMLEVADLMQRANYLGADMAFMQSAIGNAAPILDITKTKGAEAMRMLTPFMVMMNQAGMEDGGSVGNAARKIYDRAMNSKKVGKANAVLQDAGAKFKLDFTNGKGEFGGLDNLFAQLAKLRNLTTVQRGMVMNALWGDDAETTRVLSKWIEDNQAGYNETAAKMKAQADLMQRVDEQLGTLENKADAAMGSYSNLLKALGETIAPELKQLLDWLGSLAAQLKDWTEENPRVAKTFMLIAAGGAALLVVAGTLGLALVGVAGALAMARLVSGRFLLNLLGLHAAGGKAAAGTGLAARAASWLTAAWGAIKTLGIGGIFKAIGPQIAQMLTPLTSLRGVLGIMRGGLLGLLKLVFTFARANPFAAAIMGIAGLAAGLYAHWDKISEFASKGEWLNMGKEIWAAVEWGLNAASLGLYDFFKTIAMKALGAVREGVKSAVGWGNEEQAQDPVKAQAVQKMRAATAALAMASTAAVPAVADIPKIEAARQKLAQASIAAHAAGANLSPAALAFNTGQVKLLRAAGTEERPQLHATAVQLQPLASLAPRAAAAPAPVITNTNSFQITAAPGMDEKGLARAIGFEMDRRARAEQSRRLGLMRDAD